jgi:hypothetical protein
MTLDEIEAEKALLRLIAAGAYPIDDPTAFAAVYPLVRRGLVSVYTDGNSNRVFTRLKQAGKQALASAIPTGL